MPLTADVAAHAAKAIVAAEDIRFYEHHGVDVKGVLRAFVANQHAGEVVPGRVDADHAVRAQRSSATRPPPRRRSSTPPSRPPAGSCARCGSRVQLEKQLTKQQILERYLNVAYFGHRAYGIYAASEVYFSKTPADLTLAEAALLAGLVKAPTDLRPGRRNAGRRPASGATT